MDCAFCVPPAFRTDVGPSRLRTGRAVKRRQRAKFQSGSAACNLSCDRRNDAEGSEEEGVKYGEISRRCVLQWMSQMAVMGSLPFGSTCSSALVEEEGGQRLLVPSPGSSPLEQKIGDVKCVHPPNRLRAHDVFYPEWMAGVWRCESVLRLVSAPSGESLFGRTGTLDAAKKDVGSSLIYNVRFYRTLGGGIVADRSYNVTQISKAAMGAESILQVVDDVTNPDIMKLDLLPRNAGGTIYKVDLRVLGREVDANKSQLKLPASAAVAVATATEDAASKESPYRFVCAELIRESISPQLTDRPPPVKVRDAETISSYTFDSGNGSIRAVQQTALFYPNGSPRAKAIKEHAIDLRVYDLTYTRLPPKSVQK